MQEWLVVATQYAVLVINAMALVVIAIGSIEAFFSGLGVMLTRSARVSERRAVWFQFAQWLIAGLTFQLAADVIGTSISPSWDEVGRLAAIAAIRTFLSFFLERDMAEAIEMPADGQRGSAPPQ